MNSISEPLTPFIKWAGGKRWLAARLRPLFENSEGRYFEPFLGSGAVFFHHQPARAYLSDANPELINCYLEVRDNPTHVQALLEDYQTSHDDEFYYKTRSAAPLDKSDQAARFLYLNRTCWNGLYRVNRAGEFNVPRGTKDQIILTSDDFPAASAALSGAEILTSDFEETIDKAVQGDVVFADPPYTVAHNKNGFIKYNQTIFSWSDQIRLAAAVTRAADRGVGVVVTNADHADVEKLYPAPLSLRSVARHSVISGSSGGRRKTSELLITNVGGLDNSEIGIAVV